MKDWTLAALPHSELLVNRRVTHRRSESVLRTAFYCLGPVAAAAVQRYFFLTSAFQFVTIVSGIGPFVELASVIRKRRPSAVTS